MVDKRRMIGNEIVGGGQKPLRRRLDRQTLADGAVVIQVRRQQLIDVTARPPSIPLPKPVTAKLPESTASFNQIAYSVLLIAILTMVAVATPFINWAFLAYGLLAVAGRLPSRIIFSSALICLLLIPITSALLRSSLADIFAVMTFYFLLIGVIRAALELRRDSLVAES